MYVDSGNNVVLTADEADVLRDCLISVPEWILTMPMYQEFSRCVDLAQESEKCTYTHAHTSLWCDNKNCRDS